MSNAQMKALNLVAPACLLSPLGPKLICLALFVLLCVFKAYFNYGPDHTPNEVVIIS